MNGQHEVVTREFMQATSLLDAAMKDWTGLFRACVTDGFGSQVVETWMGMVFDMPADDGYGIET